jgi:alkylation response protein AidB-like acyl-CoA dehydrogenase
MMEIDPQRMEALALIAESASFLAEPQQLARARQLRHKAPGIDTALWRTTAELGWLGMLVAEDDGGAGLGSTEFIVLCEKLGAGLIPEPVLQAIGVAPLLSGSLRERLLAGDAIVLPAWTDDLRSQSARPSLRVENRRLIGTRTHVLMAAAAEAFVVDVDGGLYLVDARSKGVAMTMGYYQDGCHFGDLTFDGSPAELIQRPHAVVSGQLILGLSAYLLGVMRGAFALTAEYLRTREQFGKPIGSFQALQHRMVDLYVQIQLTAASIRQAAALHDSDPDGAPTAKAVSRAKARASDASMLVTKQAIQLHGGIGFSDEADIGLFLRKAMTLANLYGSSAQHRLHYAQL